MEYQNIYDGVTTLDENEDGGYVLIPTDTSMPYPVLYLIHGTGGCKEWIDTNCGNIVQNMNKWIERYHFKPMILVMPNIPQKGESDSDPFFLFQHDQKLKALVKSFSENHQELVVSGRENTAIAGFSMGGAAALYYAIENPSLFQHVGAFSSSHALSYIDANGKPAGWLPDPSTLILNTNPAGYNLIGCGSEESIQFKENTERYYNAFHTNLVPIQQAYFEASGAGHCFLTFNALLEQFLKADFFGNILQNK